MESLEGACGWGLKSPWLGGGEGLPKCAGGLVGRRYGVRECKFDDVEVIWMGSDSVTCMLGDWSCL